MVLKRVGIFLVTALMVATGVQAKVNAEKRMVQHSVWGMKGLILGLQQGLLNNERLTLPENCFAEQEVDSKLFFISKFMARDGNLWDAYHFAIDGKDIILNQADNCHYTSTISLLQDFCQSHDYQEETDDHPGFNTHDYNEADPDWSADWNREKKLRCSQSKMIENFYMRLFNFYGSYFRVTNYWKDMKADKKKNNNDVYLTMIAIGREIGKDMRILFDFHLTDESREKVVEYYYDQ